MNWEVFQTRCTCSGLLHRNRRRLEEQPTPTQSNEENSEAHRPHRFGGGKQLRSEENQK